MNRRSSANKDVVPHQPAEVRRQQTFARGSVLNLLGATINGLFSFALVMVLTQRAGEARVGAFMVGLAALTIAAQAAQIGANTGLVRFISLLEYRGQVDLARSLIRRVLFVVMLAGIILGSLMFVGAPWAAGLLGSGENSEDIVVYIQAMSVFVPFAALFMSASMGSQGFKTMTPSLVIDKISRPVIQVVFVGFLATSGVWALAIGYGIVYPIGLFFSAIVLWRLTKAANQNRSEFPRADRSLIVEFWKFSLPRSLSTTFQVGIMWADTILIGFMLSAADAAVYAVATRFLVIGGLVVAAILQALNPRLASALVAGDLSSARRLYQRGAKWVVSAVWPLYLIVAIYAPWLLLLFGPAYQEGALALRIVAIAMMISGAFGAVDSVLLMGGRSWLSVGNWGAGFAVNLVLNLLLIPIYGIEGAAVAWAASIIMRNVVPSYQIRRIYGLQPITPGYLRVVIGSILFIGMPSLIAVVFLGTGPEAFLASVLPGGVAYLLLLQWSRRRSLGTHRRRRTAAK